MELITEYEISDGAWQILWPRTATPAVDEQSARLLDNPAVEQIGPFGHMGKELTRCFIVVLVREPASTVSVELKILREADIETVCKATRELAKTYLQNLPSG